MWHSFPTTIHFNYLLIDQSDSMHITTLLFTRFLACVTALAGGAGYR